MAKPPVYVPVVTPGPVRTGGIATNHDASRIYAGRLRSPRADRRNLLVFRIDEDGNLPEADPALFRDTAEQLPLPPGGDSSVSLAQVSPEGTKLYLGVQFEYAKLPRPLEEPEPPRLTVYDLDPAGDPTGAPRSYDFGNTKGGALLALARHPKANRLYLGGGGEPRVVTYALDGAGEPQGDPSAFSVQGLVYSPHEIAVNPAGDRMYIGTYQDTLLVVPLDPATGLPADDQQARAVTVSGLGPGKSDFLRFHYTPSALYVRRHRDEFPTPQDREPLVLPLDADGYPPTGAAQVAVPKVTTRLLALAPGGSRLVLCGDETFTDVTGAARVCGTAVSSVALDDAGRPLGEPERSARAAYAMTPVAMTVSGDGTPVVFVGYRSVEAANHVRQHLRVSLLGIEPAAEQALIDVQRHSPGAVVPAQPVPVTTGGTAVIPLDGVADIQTLFNATSQSYAYHPVILYVRARAKAQDGTLHPAKRIKLRLELFEQAPADDQEPVLDVIDEADTGDRIGLVVEWNGFIDPAARARVTQPLSANADRYLEWAKEATGGEQPPRPRLFRISCGLAFGGQGNTAQLQTLATAMGLLGFNEARTSPWGEIDGAKIDEVFNESGLTWRSHGGARPYEIAPKIPEDIYLVSFDFYLKWWESRPKQPGEPESLRAWASDRYKEAADVYGGGPIDLATYYMYDEPAWPYPHAHEWVRRVPAYLEAFHRFLEVEHGFRPADLGATTWAGVTPSGEPGQTLERRRLYYWTARFFAESAARGQRMLTEALEAAAGPGLCTVVNWNNFVNAWHIDLNKPGAATGSHDWFTAGRLDANNAWTEDWVNDDVAPLWSVHIGVAASAASLGTRPLGSYLVGRRLTGHPEGAAYKALSLIGHGGKHLNHYTFGPHPFTADAWSETKIAYESILDANRVIAAAEHLLHPGRRLPGSVAILATGASPLWDENSGMTGYVEKAYMREKWTLYLALVHAGYRVDFVDDTMVADGTLRERGYSTLYAAEPNMTAAAQDALVAWVGAGGTLVAGPGAVVADEYDAPSGRLDTVLGLAPRQPDRSPSQHNDAVRYRGLLRVPADGRFGTEGPYISGPVVPLEPRPGGAEVVALAESFDAGADVPVITRNAHGNGTAYSYGFFPGRQYEDTLDSPLRVGGQPATSNRRLIRGWDATRRRLIAAPADIAGAAKYVRLSQELVEALPLYSAEGIAIVLLNWSDDPIESLELRLSPHSGPFRRVHTARGAHVDYELDPTHEMAWIFRMPLRHTDVLLLERQVS